MHSRLEAAITHWQYVFFAVAAAVLVYSHTPIGAALSMDSLYYLSTARNILDGNGIAYTTYALNGPEVQATTLWPPLYPVLLAGIVWLAELIGVSDVVAIAVVNFIGLLASLYLMSRIVSLAGWSWAGFIVVIAFALAPSLQLVFLYAWSEVVFIPLSLAAYLSLQQYLVRNDAEQRRALFSMVFLLALATYTRYVGIALFGAAALAVLVYDRGNLIERLRAAVLAAITYLALIAPMLIRNFLVADALSGGDRGTLNTNLATDLGLLLWYLYLEFVNLPKPAGVTILVLGVLILAWLLFRESGTPVQAKQPVKSINIVVPVLFAASYCALLLISRMTQITDLDSRMLSAAVPFLLIALLGVYQRLTVSARVGLAVIPFVLPLCAFALNGFNTHSNIVKGWRDQGEPGTVLGLSYPSMTGPRLDTLRSIGAHFALNPGDLLLTDIAQPLIAGNLFPELDVRKIPGEPSGESLAALENAWLRKGIAIIGDPDWGQALTNRLEGRADFYRIESASGVLEYIVITLPIRTQ